MAIADKLTYLDETKERLRRSINEILRERGEPELTTSDTFRSYADAIFTPHNLFTNGEQGAWYDPSDLPTLFQDSAGTTPVTADGDPVGLMLDKSGNGNYASQSTDASRPIYRTDGTLHWLDGNGSGYFTISGSASSMSFLTKGAGATVIGSYQAGITADPNARYGLIGNDISNSTTNISILFDDRASVPRNDRLVVNVPQSGINTITEDGGFPANQGNIFSFFYDLSAPAQTYVNSTLLVEDPTGSTAPQTDMVRDLQLLCASPAGGAGDIFVGRFYGLILIDRVMDLDSMGETEGYLADKMGGHPL